MVQSFFFLSSFTEWVENYNAAIIIILQIAYPDSICIPHCLIHAHGHVEFTQKSIAGVAFFVEFLSLCPAIKMSTTSYLFHYVRFLSFCLACFHFCVFDVHKNGHSYKWKKTKPRHMRSKKKNTLLKPKNAIILIDISIFIQQCNHFHFWKAIKLINYDQMRS